MTLNVKDSLQKTNFVNKPIPARAGIGLRSPHLSQIAESGTSASWLEIHSENYFAEGGKSLELLTKIREDNPISMHGVSLSLGTAEGIDKQHLQRIKNLAEIIQPALISEHISWNVSDGTYLNDLIPIPYNQEALDVICRNVSDAQDFLGRQILMENPSAYLQYNLDNCMGEGEFITQLVKRTGCGLLLDVNNIFVTSSNMKWNPEEHLASMPLDAVQEIHLAGHSVNEYSGQKVLIDTHSKLVCPEVWELYKKALEMLERPIPTLIEWDADIPELKVLEEEAERAQAILNSTNFSCGLKEGKSHVG